ncbi:MAG: 3',5'-cyclic-AMP phosphodiesterase [Sedimenticola sp.]
MAQTTANTTQQGAIRVLQISDSHLYADPDRELAGLKTLETFNEVIELAISREKSADLVIATGDLVHDASERGYETLREGFEQLSKPVFCMPGNHDEPETLNRMLHQGDLSTVKWVTRGEWLLLFLDSTKPGQPGGHLDKDELAFLDSCLGKHPQHQVLVCLHHQPVHVGSSWIDSMALENPGEFFDIIDHHPGVRGILWGHIHQAFEERRNGVRLMGSPSTCIQFAPREEKFKLEAIPPGYRWLELLPDGEIRTGIERLEMIPRGLNLENGGY